MHPESTPGKACSKCGQWKPFEGFYQDRGRSDGRRNSCIDCDKARKRTPEVRVQSSRYYHSEKGKAAERRYYHEGNGREVRKAYAARPDVAEKRKARGSVYTLRYMNTEASRQKLAAYRLRPEYADMRRRVRAKSQHKRRALSYALPSSFTDADWVRARAYFNGRCAYCGEPGELERDHFVPLTRGGGYTPDNVVPACRRCNSSKYNTPPEVWCNPETYASIQRYFASFTDSEVDASD